MPTYNLPAINYDPMPAPSNYGRWETATDLNGLANALRVPSTSARTDHIKSVPDAWAQVHIGGQGLTDPSHELHDSAVAQWRGLLALFALQPFFTDVYEIEVAPVALHEHDKGRRRLRRVLHDLMPKVRLTPDVSWAQAGVILVRDKSGGAFSRGERTAVGLLSPWTLVAPGKGAPHLVVAGAPWVSAGLADPTTVQGLASDHYSALCKYLEGVADSLERAGAARHDHDLFAEMRRRLGEFYEACKRQVLEPAKLAPSELRLDWPAPLFAALGASWGMDEAGIPDGDSRARLEVITEAEDLFGGVVLVDPELAKTFKAPAQSIRVWERHSLSDASNPVTLEKIKAEAASKGVVVVEPADFFTPKLVKFKAGADIPGHPQSFRQALLPLSPLALLLFDRETLAGAIKLSDRGGAHVVELTLPLAFDDRRSQVSQHTLTRTYADGDVLVEDMFDNLSIWPDFQSEDWRWTYLNYLYDPAFDLKARYALSARFLKRDILAQAKGEKDRIRVLKEWISANPATVEKRLLAPAVGEFKDRDGELILQRLRYRDAATAVAEFQRLPLGADAVYFSTRDDDLAAGCALIRSAPVAGHGEATVAIDFGTTNTIAYFEHAKDFKLLRFEDHVTFPIQRAHNLEALKRGLFSAYTEFFPIRDFATPQPTVVKKREFRDGMPKEIRPTSQGGHDAHGFSDLVFFPPPYEDSGNFANIKNWAASDLLVFDIKWSTQEARRRLIKRFLRQIMLMTAAELVKKGVAPLGISWRFSYPQAFSRKDRVDFERFVHQAWEDLFGELAGERHDAAKYVSLETEAAAAFKYFTLDPQQGLKPVGDTIIMLDIGGGTTDVAISFKKELVWRNSVRLAGGHFFTKFLANNHDILKKINFQEVVTFIEGHTGRDKALPMNFIELFVNHPDFTKNFERSYPGFVAEAQGRALRDCAMTALGGMFYYLGLVLRQFIADGKKIDLNNLTIAFGGRGSALFRQFDLGEEGDTDLDRLGRVLLAAAGHADPAKARITNQFSLEPKHEVARGLLYAESKLRTSKDGGWTADPLGESVVVERGGAAETLPPDAQADALVKAEAIDGVGRAGIDAFLALLKKHVGLMIDIDAYGGKAVKLIQRRSVDPLREAVRDAAVGWDDEAGERIAFEPPFVTELRTLVDIMNLPIADRDNQLNVKDISS